ncbi:unnamed protein product, partial [Rotaria sordida]
PAELGKAYANLGANKKLGFSGRPDRPIGVLGTCKVYRICSKTVLSYPLTFETNDFYVSNDMALLLDNIRVNVILFYFYERSRNKIIHCSIFVMLIF